MTRIASITLQTRSLTRGCVVEAMNRQQVGIDPLTYL
jgi:hypothetical protein